MADIYDIADSYSDSAAEDGGLPRIELIDAYGSVQQMVELSARGVTIGRAPTNDIVLDDPEVARFQVRVAFDGDLPMVTDLGTRQSALLDGQPLPAQVAQPWFWGQLLQVGPFTLRADRQLGPRDEEQGYETLPLATPDPTRLGVALDPGAENLRLTPGQPQPVRVELSNRGGHDDLLALQVDGVDPSWVQLPAPVAVPAGGGAVALISVTVPRGAAGRAGDYPITVRARSTSSPSDGASAGTYWSVLPFSESQYELHPRKRSVRGSDEATYTLTIRNLGNATTAYSVRLGDNEPALDYTLDQSQVVLEPGAETHLSLGAQLRERPSGDSQSFTFGVQAQPAGGTPWSDSAQLQWQAPYPGWLWIAALLGLLLLLLGGLALWAVTNNQPDVSAAPGTTLPGQPSPTAGGGAAGIGADGTPVAGAALTEADLAALREEAVQEALAGFQLTSTSISGNAAATAQAVADQAVAQVLAQQAAQATDQAAQNQQGDQPGGEQGGQPGGEQGGQQNPDATQDPNATQGANTTQEASATPTVTPTTTPTLTPVPANKLSFEVQPDDITTNEIFENSVIVRVLDSSENLFTASESIVRLTLESTNGSGQLTGNTEIRTTTGRAVFNDLSVNAAGIGYRLIATVSVQGRTLTLRSRTFNVTAGLPNELIFSPQPPTKAFLNQPFSQAVVVRVLDRDDNLADFNGQVTLTLLDPGSSGAELLGDRVKTAVAGIATFTNLRITRRGDFQISAAITNPTLQVSSNIINVTGLPRTITIVDAPGEFKARTVPSKDVIVEVRDDANVVIENTSVRLELSCPSNTSSLLLDLRQSTNNQGRAVFDSSNLEVNTRGTGDNCSLKATATEGPVSTNRTVKVTADDPTQIVFAVQPGSGLIGQPLSPSPEINLLDSLGNISGISTNITLTLLDANGASLVGYAPISGATGIARFEDLGVNRRGTYRLRAAAGSLPTEISDSFLVTATPSRVEITQFPPTFTAGTSPAQPVVVRVLDQSNIPLPIAGSVALELTCDDSVLLNLSLPAPTGVVTFTTQALRITRAGTGSDCELKASITAPALSDPKSVAVVAGPPSQLVFTQQPPASHLSSLSQGFPVAVEARDSVGNRAGIVGNRIDLDLYQLTNPNDPNSGVLIATLPASATGADGVNPASFASIILSRAGANYYLRASLLTTPAIAASSNLIAVTASQLVFTGLAQPPQPASSFVAGAVMSFQVEARDELGTLDTTFNGAITLGIQSGGCPSISLGNPPPSAVANNGVAPFNTISITQACTSYTLTATATSSGTTIRGSVPIIITPEASPAQIGFMSLTPGPDIAAGATITIQLEAIDRFGNRVTNYPTITNPASFGTISLNFVPGTTPATNDPAQGLPIPGITRVGVPVSFTGGTATFGISVNRVHSGYRLHATNNDISSNAINGLPDRASTAFNITPGPVNTLVYTDEPQTSLAADEDEDVNLTVQRRDDQDNRVPGSGGATASFELIAPVGCTPAPPAQNFGNFPNNTTPQISFDSNGNAALTDTNNGFVRRACAGYRIRARTGAISALSDPFTVTAGPAARLSFARLPQPTSPITDTFLNAGESATTVISSTDAFTNPVLYTRAVTLTLQTPPACNGQSSDLVTNTMTRTNELGRITLGNFVINRRCPNHQLTIIGTPPVTGEQSDPFAVFGAGEPYRLSFVLQPGSRPSNPAQAVNDVGGTNRPYTRVNTVLRQQPIVQVLDRLNSPLDATEVAGLEVAVSLIRREDVDPLADDTPGSLTGDVTMPVQETTDQAVILDDGTVTTRTFPSVANFNTADITAINNNGLRINGAGCYQLEATLTRNGTIVQTVPAQVRSDIFCVDIVDNTPTGGDRRPTLTFGEPPDVPAFPTSPLANPQGLHLYAVDGSGRRVRSLVGPVDLALKYRNGSTGVLRASPSLSGAGTEVDPVRMLVPRQPSGGLGHGILPFQICIANPSHPEAQTPTFYMTALGPRINGNEIELRPDDSQDFSITASDCSGFTVVPPVVGLSDAHPPLAYIRRRDEWAPW